MKVKWLNFTKSVQGVLRQEDAELATAKEAAARDAKALQEAQAEKAALATRLSDVSTEAQRMSGALQEQGGKHDALEAQLAGSEKKLRAAEAAAERNAARAAASEQALKKEKD